MKKITSIILLLTIISSCFVFSGCDWEKIWGNDHQVEEVELNEELISNMKWDYLRTFDIKDVSHSGVLVEYCSDKLYNGYAVAMLDGCRHKPDGATENIGGVDFKYFDTNRIYAYKNGTFLTLEEAYSQEILTVEDLREISDAYGSDHTYYHQVCDFFDWTKGHTAFDMEEDETRDRLLVVLFSGKDIPPKSFFEVQSNSGIKVSEIIDLREQHDAYKYYYSEYGDLYLELVFDKAYTFKELEIYAKRLVEKPGIYLAGTHPDFTYPAFEAVTEITDTDIWALDYINVEKLWHFTENLLFIDVGVVDTGIAEHIDISGVMSNDDETDFFHNSGICRDDPAGHGTFVAGIIGATANNTLI